MTISHGNGQGRPTDKVRVMEQTLQKEGALGSVKPLPIVYAHCKGGLPLSRKTLTSGAVGFFFLEAFRIQEIFQ